MHETIITREKYKLHVVIFRKRAPSPPRLRCARRVITSSVSSSSTVWTPEPSCGGSGLGHSALRRRFASAPGRGRVACRRRRRRAVLGWSGSAGRWRRGGVGTNRGELVGRGVHVVEYMLRKAPIGARVDCVAAAWRRRLVSALLQTRSPSCGCRRFQGGGGPQAPMCCPPVVRGSRWASRQQGWAGGPREPPAGAVQVRGVLAAAQHDCTCKQLMINALTWWHVNLIPQRTPQRRESAAAVCASPFTQAMIRRVPRARRPGIERRNRARGHGIPFSPSCWRRRPRRRTCSRRPAASSFVRACKHDSPSVYSVSPVESRHAL